jgi:hypothetical protein
LSPITPPQYENLYKVVPGSGSDVGCGVAVGDGGAAFNPDHVTEFVHTPVDVTVPPVTVSATVYVTPAINAALVTPVANVSSAGEPPECFATMVKSSA